MMAYQEDPETPIGKVLGALSRTCRVKRTSNGYMAKCPAHADGTASLSVSEGDDGRALINCLATCKAEDVVTALGLRMQDLFPVANDNQRAEQREEKREWSSLTLEEFSQHKKIPVDFLESMQLRNDKFKGAPSVAIPYVRLDGTIYKIKQRYHRTAKKGSYWPKGAETACYVPDRCELARAEHYVLLVEGESDTLTALHAGFPAIGIPGANNVKSLTAEHLQEIERLYFVREPDVGGDGFAKEVPARLEELGFRGAVHEVRLPNGAKDISDLWQRDQKGFADIVNATLAAARKRDARDIVEWRTTEQIFEPLPPVRWAIRGLKMPPGRPSIWGGYGASAKTISMQALLLACASGTPAFGYFDTEPMKVLHFDYEQGWHATARRYQRLAIGHGIRREALENRLQVTIFPKVRLDDPNAVDVYAKLCDGAGLAVIDALRGSMPTQDENDSRIREHIDKLTHISERTGCAFVLLHHAAKPKESHADKRMVLRGSAAIFDAAGPVFVAVAGKSKDDPRTVSQEKMAAEAEGLPVEDFHLVVEDVPGPGNPTAGVRVLHRAITEPDEIAANSAQLDSRTSKVIDVVRRYPGESKSKIVARAGITKSTGLDIIRDLERAGRVRVEPGASGGERVFLTAANSQQKSGGTAD
jgi:hypothetical protein